MAASDDDAPDPFTAAAQERKPATKNGAAQPAGSDPFTAAAGQAPPPAPPPPEPLGPVGQAAGLAGAIGHGLSFGLDRPLDALTSYLFPNTGFAQLQAQRDQLQQQYQTEHPIAAAAGEAAGSVPTFMIGEGALGRVIPGTIGQGENILSKAGNVVGQSVKSGIVGGAAGGGLADGDAMDRAKGAGVGAATGAIVPPAFAAIGSVLKGIVGPIVARFGGANSQAVGKIAEAAVRDGISPDDLAAGLKALGTDATLADVGGRNVQQLGAAVASKPGEAAQIAQQTLEERAAKAPQVVNDAITAATGSTGDFHAALASLGAERSADASPLYKAAYSAELTPEAADAARAAQRFAQGPIGDRALQQGVQRAQLEAITKNEAFNPADYGVVADGKGHYTIDPNGPPNLRLLDAIKRGYDDVVDSYRDQTTGKLSGEGYAPNEARKQLVSELRDISPTYAQALDAWAGPSAAMDALSLGRRALTNDPEVTAGAISKLTDSEKDMFKVGVARALKDKVDSAQEGADVTRRIFGNTLIRNKIAAAFGDPAAFDQFQTTMEQQARFAKTKNAILAGSRTAPLLAAQGDADVITPLLLAATGRPGAAALNVGGQAYNALSGAAGAGPTTAAIGRLLFAQPPTDEFLAALQKQVASRANLLSARQIPRALATTAPIATNALLRQNAGQ